MAVYEAMACGKDRPADEQISDLNLFMMCRSMNAAAVSELPAGFHLRTCRPDELDLWKRMHFDDPEEAGRYLGAMTSFFNNVYGGSGDLFFRTCLFACDGDDAPVGTCFAWKAYGRITTIHWFKVLKGHEGRGLGRALLSVVMKGIAENEYPVYLHTQPSSYRAIKLYTDFGFSLLTDPIIGGRRNDLEECLPILQRHMPKEAYEKLRRDAAPADFLAAVSSSPISQF